MKFLVVGLIAVLLAQSALCMDGQLRGSGDVMDPIEREETGDDMMTPEAREQMERGGPVEEPEDDEAPTNMSDEDSNFRMEDMSPASRDQEFPAVVHDDQEQEAPAKVDAELNQVAEKEEAATVDAEKVDEVEVAEKEAADGVEDAVVGAVSQLKIEGNKIERQGVETSEFNLVKFMANGLLKIDIVAECGADTKQVGDICVREDEGAILKNKALTFEVADADESAGEASAIKEAQTEEVNAGAEFSGVAKDDKEYTFNEVEISPIDESTFRMTLKNVMTEEERAEKGDSVMADQTRTASSIDVGAEVTTQTENGDVTTVPIRITGGDGGEWNVVLTVDAAGMSSFSAERE